MSDREEFEKWARSIFCGYSFDFWEREYDHAEIDSAYMGWNADRASTQAKLDEKDAEIGRLRNAIQRALDDEESGTGWGPDVTVCAYLREALQPPNVIQTPKEE